MFTKETYINRRKLLTKGVDSGILLFLGNNDSGMNYQDNTYHFRQDSTFLYFFGLDFPSIAAIIDIDEGKEVIFGNELTIDDIVWMGTQPTLKQKSELIGVSHTEPLSKLQDYLNRALCAGRKVHFLPPYRDEHRLTLQELLRIHPQTQAAEASVDFIKAVVNQRSYKSQEEIEQIEEAVDTSANMHIAMMQHLRPGMKESEIAALVTEIALRDGGQLSFPVIATINGQTLHNHYHGNVVKDGQMLLLDAGAENKMHYSGDLSSTCPVGKKFTAQQRVIYDIALKAHMEAVESLRPGIPFRDVHLKAAATIVEGMKSIGLMKGDPVEAANAGAHAMFFPCGLGHMMGMDVHDMENLGEVWVGYDGAPKSTLFGLKSLRLGRELEPGFVLTIEPGIYFIPELIDMWRGEGRFEQFLNYSEIEKFKGFGGIRNEEDYLITPQGKRRLGKYVPMTISEVESMR